MAKKGLKIWIMTTLTFISLIHLIDSAISFLSYSPSRILQLYPIIDGYIAQVPKDIYLYASASVTFVLWGITILIVFDNPVETFLNTILSDVQKQKEEDKQTLENNSDFFDLMFENMEENNEKLGTIKDLVRNIRAEVKDIQPIKEQIEKTRGELTNLKKQVLLVEEKMIFPLICSACGKPLRADFNLCPYCGQEITLQQISVIKKPETNKKRQV